jgi:hypothetical protein
MQNIIESQSKLILAHLQKGNAITPIEALNMYGCFRLSARIKDLRDQGVPITMERVTRAGKSFASYRIADK